MTRTKTLTIALMLFAFSATALSADYERTLRVDYIFSGTATSTEIAVCELSSFDGWAGRRHNMDSVPLRGNGQIVMRDAQSLELLYMTSFSTLFQEWQCTEEATRLRKSFENVFLLPMPHEKAVVSVTLFGFKGEITAEFEHTVDPSDILIRQRPVSEVPYRELLVSGSAQDCIDVAIVAEGYTAEEAELFYQDAGIAMNEILSHEPFRALRGHFNFIAVAPASKHSGVSVPSEGIWKETAVGASFDTFYTERYLTTLHLFKLHDLLAGLPYEHIIILANTETYGGGGIYNSYTLTTTHNPYFRPVVVHEFGHSFAGLGDEYYYDDQYSEQYYPGIEPWEPNITTLADFPSKWQHLLCCEPERDAFETDSLDLEAFVPTAPVADLWKQIAGGADPASFVGIYEGGGYQSKGVYRGEPDCRMKTNAAPVFCPVCQDAIRRLIEFYL